jgi:hypothetical protein
MTREQLEHAIRAICEICGDSEIWIFGSQAILGEFPNAPKTLCASIEVDVQPKNRSDTSDAIEAVLGELSLFHQTHGFYVHALPVAFVHPDQIIRSHWQAVASSNYSLESHVPQFRGYFIGC